MLDVLELWYIFPVCQLLVWDFMGHFEQEITSLLLNSCI